MFSKLSLPSIRRRPRVAQPPTPPSSAHTPHTQPTMGNAPSSASTSSKRRAATVERASTTSTSTSVTSQYMPGSETPRAAPRTIEPTSPGVSESKPPTPPALQVDVQPDTGNVKLDDLEAGAREPELAVTPRAEPRRISEVPAEPFARPLSPAPHGDDPDEDTGVPEPSTPPGLTQHVQGVRAEPQHAHAARPAWLPGTYVLQNARRGTALDLCGGDSRALVGFPAHGGTNQQWEFVPSGAGYTIRSAAPAERYLTVADGLCEGAAVTAGPFPASWSVQADEREGTVRISWPNTDFVLALTDSGGDKVQLVKATPGELGELWRFVHCAQPEGERTARTHLPPITTETVIVAEERDCVTTTRTTTTTVVTTITTVTRTPRSVP